jgi:hypothetical protein
MKILTLDIETTFQREGNKTDPSPYHDKNKLVSIGLKFVDGESEVIDMEVLVNEVALLRNRYLGVLKGLESKNFMMGHLVRLKVAGQEDFTL